MVADKERFCCASYINTWHTEDCRVGGPTGPIVVGDFTHAGTDIVRELAGVCRVPGCDHDPDNLNCVNPGRWGEQGSGCAPDHDWHFIGRRNGKSYARERIREMQELTQRVVMPLYRNGRWPVRVIHDTVPNDRTFENETRPL